MKTYVHTRNDFAALLCEMKLTERAAEIGVAEGYFSFHLLDRWPGTCFLIDPWRVLDVAGYSVHGENDQESRFARVAAKVAKVYRGRAILKRATSAEAAPTFTAGFFDFVYIDANHTLEAVREDVALWWPKVRHGGILAGHDYLQGVVGGVDYGVKQAVDEFAHRQEVRVLRTSEEDYPSWWILKP